MPSVVIETHGCKLNLADTIAMASDFSAAGFKVQRGTEPMPDVFVLNSCTVTHVADKKARQRLSAVRRGNPDALIVLAGCLPTRDGQVGDQLDAVDLTVANAEKPAIAEQVWAALASQSLNGVGADDVWVNPAAAIGRTRAAVKIQEGCDQVCAFCIVPRVRGRERSVPVGDLIAQTNRLHDRGCREVVLTGTQLGHYGFDLEGSAGADDLPTMLRQLLADTDVPRIRVSSLQAGEIDAELLAVWTDEGAGRLCPHFHVPLQSGSDDVLRRMRRTYTADEFAETVALVRAAIPDCAITTDIIAGFPGETDADHSATLAMLHVADFADAHVFPYSRRPGTTANLLDDQVAPDVIARRAAEIREVCAGYARRYRESEVGLVRTVLWEGAEAQSGLTENYLRVRLRASDAEDYGHPRRRQEGALERVILAGVGVGDEMWCVAVGGADAAVATEAMAAAP